MTKTNGKFEELVTELEELILKQVPKIKNHFTILERRGEYDLTEIENKAIEMDKLKRKYTQITKDLIEIDKKRANLEIKEIIRKRNMLDANYKQDLKNARIGTIWEI